MKNVFLVLLVSVILSGCGGGFDVYHSEVVSSYAVIEGPSASGQITAGVYEVCVELFNISLLIEANNGALLNGVTSISLSGDGYYWFILDCSSLSSGEQFTLSFNSGAKVLSFLVI